MLLFSPYLLFTLTGDVSETLRKKKLKAVADLSGQGKFLLC